MSFLSPVLLSQSFCLFLQSEKMLHSPESLPERQFSLLPEFQFHSDPGKKPAGFFSPASYIFSSTHKKFRTGNLISYSGCCGVASLDYVIILKG